jgi:hypothetical protein
MAESSFLLHHMKVPLQCRAIQLRFAVVAFAMLAELAGVKGHKQEIGYGRQACEAFE